MRYGVDGDSVEFVVSGILSKKKWYLRKERVKVTVCEKLCESQYII